jgi:regulation of enolase protein 1 (concanavalin A-like superfamily)
MKSDLVDIDVRVEGDEPADQAILVKIGGEKHWLPRSQIEIEYTDQHKHFATVTLPEWLAIDKGLV